MSLLSSSYQLYTYCKAKSVNLLQPFLGDWDTHLCFLAPLGSGASKPSVKREFSNKNMPIWRVAGHPDSSVQDGCCGRLQCLVGTFEDCSVMVGVSWWLSDGELH